jgi:flagellar biosynthesis protein FliQ
MSQVLVLLIIVVMTLNIKVFSTKIILRKTTLNFIQKLVALMLILISLSPDFCKIYVKIYDS